MIIQKVTLPVDEESLSALEAGMELRLSGVLYTARDKAHQRIKEMMEKGEELPFSLKSEFIYYVGPSPAPPGRVIGSAGPTTSYRMDPFTEDMLTLGVRGMIGKGRRDLNTVELLKKHGAVYCAAIGGAGAYLASHIVKSECVAFENLGPEAMYRIEIDDFPVVVINDSEGRDWYQLQYGNI